jgi:hypothetical protein
MTSNVDALPADISLDKPCATTSAHRLRRLSGAARRQRGGAGQPRGRPQQPPDARETTSVQAVMTPIGRRFVVASAPLSEATAKLAENGMGRLLVMLEGRRWAC